jgi:phage shock protein C
VCGGIAEYLNVDATLIRLLAVIALFAGAGFIAYIVAWIVLPEEDLEPVASPATV